MATITNKERIALLDAIDFISTNADGATDYSSYEEIQKHLRSLYNKASADERKKHHRNFKSKKPKQ